MNDMDLEQRHKRWEREFDALENDVQKLENWWIKNKSCPCDTEERGIWCKHYDKLRLKTLGKQIDDVWNLKMSMIPYQLEQLEKTIASEGSP